MHVAGILNDKGDAVVTMGPRSTVKEAIALMAQKRIGAVVIVGVENAVLGIFSERDVVRVLAQKGPEALADDLARHMTSPVFTCTPQTLIDEIMQLMTSKKFRHVPVVDGGLLQYQWRRRGEFCQNNIQNNIQCSRRLPSCLKFSSTSASLANGGLTQLINP